MPFDGVGFVSGECLQKLDAMTDLVGTPDRWCKGTLRTRDGRFCLRGAILEVGGTGLLEAPILQAIGDVTGRRCRRIEAFNDDLQTNHVTVCAVLSRARENLLAGKTATERLPFLYRVYATAHRNVVRWRHRARRPLGLVTST